MARKFSSRRFRCLWCRKLMKGYVPKGGDGTGYLMPTHKDREGKRCQGSNDLKDAGDFGKED